MKHCRAIAVICASLGAAGCASGDAPWVASWATSLYEPAPADEMAPTDFGDRTIRNAITATTAGKRARVTFSNRFGKTPLFVGSATIARQQHASSPQTSDVRALTFSGQPSIMVAPGGEILSDAVSFPVEAGARIAVSLYLPQAPAPETAHATAWRTSWISSEGDFSGAEEAAPFREAGSSWRFLRALELSGGATTAIVAIGDSLTEGYGTTVDRDRRWTDFLARRLGATAVLNAGVNGNLLLADSPCFGDAPRSRWAADVSARTGVGVVVVLSGANDLLQPAIAASGVEDACLSTREANAAAIIAEYEALAAKAHAENLRIVLGTIPPFGAFLFWSPAIEAERQKINDWIRTSTAIDGVADFDAALADPANTTKLAATYDSGDGLHPNDAGAEAMANAIDLARLLPGEKSSDH